MPKNSLLISKAFILALQVELENHSEGIGEYDLMMNLKSQGYFSFLSQPALPHELFQAHFFLFHSLYLLSNSLLEKNSHLLNIHTLKIQLLPYQEGEKCLQVDDKLKAYYLDFSNLENTYEEEVYDLLASFWNQFNRIDKREDALKELGLKDPVDNNKIKETYRRLIMQHHPDRGGTNGKIQTLNNVIKVLLD